MSLHVRVVLPEFHERPGAYFQQSYGQRSFCTHGQLPLAAEAALLWLASFHSHYTFEVDSYMIQQSQPALSPRHNELRPDLFEKILVLAGEAVLAPTVVVNKFSKNCRAATVVAARTCTGAETQAAEGYSSAHQAGWRCNVSGLVNWARAQITESLAARPLATRL